MALFIVEHEHDGDHCPARDPSMGKMLLQHLEPANAKHQGVHIHADAVQSGAHRFVLIVDGADKETIQRFMAPFAQAGSVKVSPASTCEAVVERGAC
jgi:hypothetical protein